MTTMPTTILRTIPNRFAKDCCICKTEVKIGQGFACQTNTGWQTYCAEHVPVQQVAVRAEITVNGEVHFPYSPEAVSLVKSLTGAKFNSADKFWTVTIDDTTIERVVSVGQSLGLTIHPELLQMAAEVKAESLSNLQGRFNTNGLFPFQIEGACFLQSHERCLLGDEMGTGKTIQTLAALPSQMGTLVVCPASLKYNWRDEAKKWRTDLTPVVLSGRGSFRLPNQGELVIVNYDILPQDFTSLEIKDFCLVCDEVHLCKNYKAKRSKAVKALSKIAKQSIGLTGTPLMNRPFDLFGVLSALQLEGKVFGGWMGFMRAFNGFKNRWGGYDFGRPDASVPEKMRRVMLRRRREEVLPDLPGKSYTTITVESVDKKLRKQLDELYGEVEMVLETEELPPFEMFSGIRAQLAESRIPALLEMVESHEEQEIPLVIFSAHRKPIDVLAEREGWATITGSTKPEDRQDIVRRFQAGELKGVGLTIAAGGVGLTLTRAWKAIFVDLDWTPALNSQAEDRICRIGQTKPCEIVRLVSDHILDQHIMQLISNKIALFSAAIDAKVNPIQISAVAGETDEEFAARMQAAQGVLDSKNQENIRSVAKGKVERVLDRELARKGQEYKMPEMTPELVTEIERNLESMLGVCDGANEKDNVGFNKPDAMISRWLYANGLDQVESQQCAYLMLLRYPKQVKFKNVPKKTKVVG
jgi:SWI/SNF-related matrix-associated actin-dependent regulator 1 of chromatin subfamily A